MTQRLEPSIRATFVHRLFPASLGTVTRRFSTRGLADAGAFAQGRVVSFDRISHKMTRPDGSYESDKAKIRLSDEDGYFRGLMSGPTTRYLAGQCEVTIEILSEAGRTAGADWRPLMLGPVTDVQCPANRLADVEITDALGAQFTGYDLDKTIGVPMTRDIIPGLPEASIGRIFPIVVGEHSDVGSKDANGNPNDKGKLPVVDAGWVLMAADGTFAPSDGTIGRLPAPTDLAAVVTGTVDARVRRYAVTGYSEAGETTALEISVTIPDTLGGGNSVALSWTPTPNAVGQSVYVDGRRAKTFEDGTTNSWTDDGSVSATGPGFPTTNGALINSTINGVDYNVWRMFVRKIGAGPDVHRMYGSDLATGTAPKRVELPDEAYGAEVIVYGRVGWPFATSYIEMGGVRFAPFFARGPRLQHHLNGTVTFAWNGCGDPGGNGDDNQPTITEAFFAWQHIINTYGLWNRGAGYRTGAWGTLETFEGGTEILRTSAVQACQDLTVGWIGGRGYQANIAIFTPISLREFDKRFRNTFASETASNHHGQIYPALIDDSADPTVGRLYHDRINIVKMESQDFRHTQVVTRQTFHLDWDEDAQAFKQKDLVIEDADATAAYGGRPREGQARSCYYSADLPTVHDAMSRHVMRYKVAPREVGIRTDLRGLEDECGAQVRATLSDGAGSASGDNETPFLVIEHLADPSQPGAEGAVLTLFDLARISGFALPLLEDEGTMTGNLGDETSSAVPPTGAYELR